MVCLKLRELSLLLLLVNFLQLVRRDAVPRKAQGRKFALYLSAHAGEAILVCMQLFR